MNAAIYARVSTTTQAEKGYSLETQIEACKKKAIELGATSIKEYIDDGYSGAYLERPKLGELRDALPVKLHDYVIVYDIDRLARDALILLMLTEEIEKNATLVYVNSDYNKTPEGQLFYEIRGSFAKYERIRIQDRFNRGRRGKLKKGLPLRDSKILGYDFINGHYVINEAEAKIVRHIYQLYLDTLGGYAKLTEILNNEGILSSTGKRWSRASINAILTRQNYTGTYYAYKNYRKKTGIKSSKVLHRDKSEWIEMHCPAIVSQELFDAVQQKLYNNRSKRIRESQYESLLQGILYCGICGRKMAHARFKGETYYMCGANKEKAGTCQNRICKADIIDNESWKQLEKICYDEKTIRRYMKQPAPKTQENTKEELQKLAEKKQALMSWYSQNFISMEECAKQLETIKKKETALQQKAAKVEKTVNVKNIVIPRKIELTFNDKRKFITTYVKRLTVVRKGQKHSKDYDIVFRFFF